MASKRAPAGQDAGPAAKKPARRPEAKKPSAEVEKTTAPIRVPSTRADGGPAKELALRPKAGRLGATGTTHQIQTTMRPDQTITVSEVEYQNLLALGLVYSGSPVTPAADFYDNILADKVAHGSAFPAALGTEASDSASPFGSALRAAYVPQGLGRVAAHRLVGLGDSITAADAYLRYLAALSGGSIRFAKNAGVGGNQISDMLNRFDTDVTPYAPTIVTLMGGTNDYTFGTTDDQFRQRVRSFVATVRGIGAIPVLFTSPPCNVLADPDRAKIPRNNAWMAEYAARNGILLIDAYAVWVDPEQSYGNYLAAYDPDDDPNTPGHDGIHPNNAGHWALAQAAWAVLEPLLPSFAPYVKTISDPTNLLANGLLKDNDGDGLADNWGQVWGLDSGTWAYSIVADPAVPGGTMQRVALTTATGHISRNQDITTGFAAGDQLRLTGLVTTEADTYGLLQWDAKDSGGADLAYATQRVDQVMTRGLVDMTFTIPANTATLRITFDAGALVAGTTANIDFGAITLRNETALGLLTP